MSDEKYVLATGAEGEHRLRVVNRVHGSDTETLLKRIPVKPGTAIADIGCGIGMISRVLAGMVGANGKVVGVDASAGQIEQARRRLTEAGFRNAEFHAASAYETGLERESFDMVYSRFMLMHVQRPAEAIAEMRSLLKPGGKIVLEDGDFSSPFAYPASAAYDRCFELYRLAGERQGADFHIANRLYGMVREAGFREIAVTMAQPIFYTGDEKRLPEWTLEECAPSLLETGIAAPEEIIAVTSELARLAADDSVLFAMARVTQVVGLK